MSFPLNTHLPHASRLVLGCMGFGGGWTPEALAEPAIAQAAAAVDAALQAGITVFDHADIYQHGKAEQAFGALFRRQPSLRDQLVLQSKCGIRLDRGHYDLSAAYIEQAVDASLRRLHTDRLELLLLHRPDALMEPHEVADAFTRLRAAGKVRHFGVSNFHAAQLKWLQQALPMPLVANQLQMSLLHAHGLEAGLTFNDPQNAGSLPWLGTLEHCQAQGIQLQAWGPLDRGALTQPGHPASPKVAELAQRHGVAPEAIVLAWLLRHPAGFQPVIGSTQPARIAACAQALQVQLSRDDWYGLWIAARGRPLP